MYKPMNRTTWNQNSMNPNSLKNVPNNTKLKTNEPRKFVKCANPWNWTKQSQKPMNANNLDSGECIWNGIEPYKTYKICSHTCNLSKSWSSFINQKSLCTLYSTSNNWSSTMNTKSWFPKSHHPCALCMLTTITCSMMKFFQWVKQVSEPLSYKHWSFQVSALTITICKFCEP